MNSYLGIDTSNYTTSVAYVCDEKINLKLPLSVKQNERGVRQSDALFMHTVNLPTIMHTLSEKKKGGELAAVGVSSRPRRQEGSYMPCFLAGVSSAFSIGEIYGLPVYEFSHQEGHIRAAIEGVRDGGENFDYNDFYSFHLSGGTCEFLRVSCDDMGYSATPIAISADITPGQLIDRCGVMLGYRFPCGKALDELAQKSDKEYKINIKKGNKINLSGFENKAVDMMKKGESHSDIAAFVFFAVTQAVKVMLEAATEDIPVLFAGGVSSSKFLKSKIIGDYKAFFAPAEYSMDNALGIALLAKEAYDRGRLPRQRQQYTPSDR